MQITHLHQTSSEHVTVTLSTGEEIASTLGVVAELMLYNGKEISDESYVLLLEHSARALGVEKALNLLSYSRMSAKELRYKLVRKGMAEDTAEAVIEKLKELRVLDDAEYAASVVRHYSAKGYGKGRIRAELAHRGVDREYWDEVLEDAPPADNAVDRFLEKKLDDPFDRDQVRKVSAALARRGFSWDEIRAGIERMKDGL